MKKRLSKRASKGNYTNSISKDDFKRPPLSYVELEDYTTEDGQPKCVYFIPVPSPLMISAQETGLDHKERWSRFLAAVAHCVVNPQTYEPIMDKSGWEELDFQLQKKVVSAVLGVDFEESETDESPLTPEEEAKLKEVMADPNPLDETHGSGSPTASISSSGEGPTETET